MINIHAFKNYILASQEIIEHVCHFGRKHKFYHTRSALPVGKNLGGHRDAIQTWLSVLVHDKF